MEIRKGVAVWLTVLLLLMSSLPVFAVDMSQAWRLSVTFDGESSVNMKPGESRTMDVMLERTDIGSEEATVYAVSAVIRFRSAMLEVSDVQSISGLSCTFTRLSGNLDGWTDLTLNYLSSSIGGTVWSNPAVMVSLNLTATNRVGSSMIQVRRGSVSTYSGMESFQCTTENAVASVTETPPAEDVILRFADVPPEAWYADAVRYVVTNGYFLGTSATEFSPGSDMTRAMFVTVLGRKAGVKADAYPGQSFSDVPEGEWYSSYVKWASENDIVNGVGENTFLPQGQITREQMAVIMYRYASYCDLDLSVNQESLEVFSDVSKISDWAVTATAWATGKEIISGYGNGILDPSGGATRAQVAEILRKFSIKMDPAES